MVDIDIDDDRALNLAPLLLPPTALRHGRECRPGSHWWYRIEAETPSRRFSLPDGKVVVELRCRRSQTLVPPSVHPTGDRYVWEETGQPARVSPAALQLSLAKLATAVVVSADLGPELRHAPAKVVRLLMRLGVSADDAHDIVLKVCQIGLRAEEAPGSSALSLSAELECTIRQWFGTAVNRTARTAPLKRRAKALRPWPADALDGPRPIGEVLRRLALQGCNPTPSGNGFVAHCPCHDDRFPSLSIAEADDDAVLLHCHAMCTTERVLSILGLAFRDLFPAPRRRRRRRSG